MVEAETDTTSGRVRCGYARKKTVPTRQVHRSAREGAGPRRQTDKGGEEAGTRALLGRGGADLRGLGLRERVGEE